MGNVVENAKLTLETAGSLKPQFEQGVKKLSYIADHREDYEQKGKHKSITLTLDMKVTLELWEDGTVQTESRMVIKEPKTRSRTQVGSLEGDRVFVPVDSLPVQIPLPGNTLPFAAHG